MHIVKREDFIIKIIFYIILISMYNSCFHFVENFFGKDQKKLSKKGSVTGPNIYHEKQVKELCALHSLNNLFQDRNAFTKQTLDNICHNLSPDNLVNPHKSMLGLGNYDVNVLMAALQQKGYEAMWFDKRKDPVNIDFFLIVGLILNIPSDMKFLPLPLNRKHWIAIKEIDNTFYNLDSKLDAPLVIGKEAELLSYLKEQIRCKDREIFVVVPHDVDHSLLWKKDMRHITDNLASPAAMSKIHAVNSTNSTVAVIHLNSGHERTNACHRVPARDCLVTSINERPHS